MFVDIGFAEMAIIFLVILVFFGAKRLPDLAAGLGKGIREFKEGLKDVKEEVGRPSVESPKDEGNIRSF